MSVRGEADEENAQIINERLTMLLSVFFFYYFLLAETGTEKIERNNEQSSFTRSDFHTADRIC